MNKTYVRINNIDYLAIEINGSMSDSDWDNRETKIIRFDNTSYEAVKNLLPNNTQWDIVCKWDEKIYDENGTEIVQIIPHEDVFNNNDFCLSGPITDWRDGSISIKMGKLTDLEEAYLLLYKDEESDEV